ncbi:MAG: hypothetical protein MHM6MM_002120 [Cercozoa sp. M6MM]
MDSWNSLSVPAARAANRHLACDLIGDAAVLLKLPRRVALTAQTLLFKFTDAIEASGKTQPHVFFVAAACMYLATKSEERARRVTSIFTVFDYLLKRMLAEQGKMSVSMMEPCDTECAEYRRWCAELAALERRILAYSGFVVEFSHSCDLVPHMLRVLSLRSQSQLCDDKPEYFAVAAVELAARRLMLPLPARWQQLFDVPPAACESAMAALCRVLALPRAPGFLTIAGRPEESHKGMSEHETLTPLPPAFGIHRLPPTPQQRLMRQQREQRRRQQQKPTEKPTDSPDVEILEEKRETSPQQSATSEKAHLATVGSVFLTPSCFYSRSPRPIIVIVIVVTLIVTLIVAAENVVAIAVIAHAVAHDRAVVTDVAEQMLLMLDDPVTREKRSFDRFSIGI